MSFRISLILLSSLLFLSPISHAWVKNSSCTGYNCCWKGKTDTGKLCVRRTYEAVWSDSEQKVDTTYITAKRLSKRQARKIEKQLKLDKGKIREETTAFGLADKNGKELIKTRYKKLSVLGYGKAIAIRFDGKTVMVDWKSGEETPYPYKDFYSLYTSVIELPKISLVLLEQYEDGYELYAMLGEQARELRRFTVKADDHLFHLHKSGLLFVRTHDRESGQKMTGVFDARGTHLFTADIKLFEEHQDKITITHPAVDIGANPYAYSKTSARLYMPLDHSTGLPLEVPDDLIGFTPFLQNDSLARWVMITQDGDSVRYQLGSTSMKKTLEAKDTMPFFSGVAETKLDYDLLTEGLPAFNTAESYNKRFQGWRYEEQIAVQLPESGLWVRAAKIPVMFDKAFFEKSRKVTHQNPDAAIQAAYLDYHHSIMEERRQRKLARQEKERELAARKDKALKYFNQHFGNYLSDPCNSRLYYAARLAEGEALARFVSKYQYCSDDDINKVCQTSSQACSVARNQKAENDRQVQAWFDAQAAYRARLNRNWQNPADKEVKVMIYEGGRVRQETMRQGHYDKYYKP